MKRPAPLPGSRYVFRTDSAAREKLPLLAADVVGRDIQLADQLGVFRVVSGDVVQLVELRADQYTCLITHAGTGGVLLTDIQTLHDSPLS